MAFWWLLCSDQIKSWGGIHVTNELLRKYNEAYMRGATKEYQQRFLPAWLVGTIVDNVFGTSVYDQFGWFWHPWKYFGARNVYVNYPLRYTIFIYDLPITQQDEKYELTFFEFGRRIYNGSRNRSR